MKETIWIKRKLDGADWGCFTETVNGVYLSYQSNGVDGLVPDLVSDSANPETAVVFIGDKSNGKNRCLIYRGDWRKELEKIFPDKEKLKEHWKEYGGHFWSDDLEDEE